MKAISSETFGLLIAYILPGFTALWGLARVSDTVHSWLGANPNTAPTVAGFCYATLASVVVGVTVSTLRWLLIDAAHHATGIRRPQWEFSQLRGSVDAFSLLIEIHYRYYQFYGGMMVALFVAYLANRLSLGFWLLRAAKEGATFAARGGQFSGCAMDREMQLGAVGAGQG